MTRDQAHFSSGLAVGTAATLFLGWVVWSLVWLTATDNWAGNTSSASQVFACMGVIFGGVALTMLVLFLIGAFFVAIDEGKKR